MAKKRRSSNEVSNAQLKNGSWRAGMSVKDPVTGETKRYACYGRTKIEARDNMIKTQNQLNTGSFVVFQKIKGKEAGQDGKAAW